MKISSVLTVFAIVAVVAAVGAVTTLISIHQVAFAAPNPNAPGQTGCNPGQGSCQGSANPGPPGQTDLNPGHCLHVACSICQEPRNGRC